MTAVLHVAPNTMPRIGSLWAYLSVDEHGNEVPGKIMWWKGRKLLHTDDLAKFTGPGLPFFPRDADTACLSPPDYAQINGEGCPQ